MGRLLGILIWELIFCLLFVITYFNENCRIIRESWLTRSKSQVNSYVRTKRATVKPASLEIRETSRTASISIESGVSHMSSFPGTNFRGFLKLCNGFTEWNLRAKQINSTDPWIRSCSPEVWLFSGGIRGRECYSVIRKVCTMVLRRKFYSRNIN